MQKADVTLKGRFIFRGSHKEHPVAEPQRTAFQMKLAEKSIKTSSKPLSAKSSSTRSSPAVSPGVTPEPSPVVRMSSHPKPFQKAPPTAARKNPPALKIVPPSQNHPHTGSLTQGTTHSSGVPPLIVPPSSHQPVPLSASPQQDSLARKPLLSSLPIAEVSPSLYPVSVPVSAPLSPLPYEPIVIDTKEPVGSAPASTLLLAPFQERKPRLSCDELRKRAHSAREQLDLKLMRLEGEMSSMHTRINAMSTRSESCAVVTSHPSLANENPWKRLSVPVLPMLHSVHVVREETHEGAASVDYVKEAEMLVKMLAKNKTQSNQSANIDM